MGPFFCRASERVKHIRQGLIGTVTWKNLSARPRDRHSPAHLKGASNEPARGAAMTSGPQLTQFVTARLTPGRGEARNSKITAVDEVGAFRRRQGDDRRGDRALD